MNNKKENTKRAMALVLMFFLGMTTYKLCMELCPNQEVVSEPQDKYPDKQFRVQKRQWQGKDKVKYQVQELTRKDVNDEKRLY